MHLTPLSDKEAETVASGLFSGWISTHGTPITLNSDRGSEFCAGIFRALCSKLQILQRFSSIRHPQSNGLVERANANILAYLRKYLENSNDWVPLLPSLQFSFNTAANSSTRYSPYFVAFGRRPQVPTSLLLPSRTYSEGELDQRIARFSRTNHDVIANQASAFTQQKLQFDKKARTKSFMMGDRVYITRPHSGRQFQKFQHAWEGPYQIVATLPQDNYELLHASSAKRVRIHANNMKLAPFEMQYYTVPESSLEFSLPVASRLPLSDDSVRRSLRAFCPRAESAADEEGGGAPPPIADAVVDPLSDSDDDEPPFVGFPDGGSGGGGNESSDSDHFEEPPHVIIPPPPRPPPVTPRLDRALSDLDGGGRGGGRGGGAADGGRRSDRLRKVAAPDEPWVQERQRRQKK
jgi:hypothetical protein